MRFVIEKIPAPHLPAEVTERLTTLGGCNEFGWPLLCLEWGGDAIRFLAGNWRAKYRRQGPKPTEKRLVGWVGHNSVTQQQTHYPPTINPPPAPPGCLILPLIEEVEHPDPFWYLAEWVPPEKLGPDTWELERWIRDKAGRRLDMLGEFPGRGRYQGVIRFAGLHDEFIAGDDPRVYQTAEALWSIHQELAATKGYWRDFMSPTECQQLGRDILDGIQAEQIEQYAQLREQLASEVAPMAHRLLDNPRVFLHTPDEIARN